MNWCKHTFNSDLNTELKEKQLKQKIYLYNYINVIYNDKMQQQKLCVSFICIQKISG